MKIAFRSWEDTISIPAKRGVSVDWLPDNRPGRWMCHCHILEHHAADIMAHFRGHPLTLRRNPRRTGQRTT